MSEDEQREVERALNDALPSLCMEFGRHHDEVEPRDVLEALAEYGLELRSAAPLEGE